MFPAGSFFIAPCSCCMAPSVPVRTPVGFPVSIYSPQFLLPLESFPLCQHWHLFQTPGFLVVFTREAWRLVGCSVERGAVDWWVWVIRQEPLCTSQRPRQRPGPSLLGVHLGQPTEWDAWAEAAVLGGLGSPEPALGRGLGTRGVGEPRACAAQGARRSAAHPPQGLLPQQALWVPWGSGPALVTWCGRRRSCTLCPVTW